MSTFSLKIKKKNKKNLECHLPVILLGALSVKMGVFLNISSMKQPFVKGL